MTFPSTPSLAWDQIDWSALRKLREGFLSFDATPGGDDYWRTDRLLASYDATFAERIGWKWDTLLAELQVRGWTPPPGTLLDWGCGTGVAGRRVAAAWPDAFTRLCLSDRSPRAVRFAAGRARAHFPRLTVEPFPADASSQTGPDLLVISHVLNELAPRSAGLERLLARIRSATAVLWVEPGTSATAQRLVELREQLLSDFRPVAPCPHALRCGLLSPGNERHWCHHFARIPREIFQDSGWGRFARTMEIDLSTLPFSMLVLDKRPPTEANGNARVIGEPRLYKGFAKVLACQNGAVDEVMVQKRDASALFKSLRKSPGSLYQWERESDRIREGETIF